MRDNFACREVVRLKSVYDVKTLMGCWGDLKIKFFDPPNPARN